MTFRDQALAAMGLTPAWVLREPAPAARSAFAATDQVPEPQVPAPSAPAVEALPGHALDPDSVTDQAAAPPAVPDVPVRHAPAPRPVLDDLSMDQLRSVVANCTACGLCATRRQTVAGAGALQVPWMLVGEGPGAEDEDLGSPLNGTPGRLLDNMLTAAGLSRQQEVYITNAVKCRVPDHGRPDALALAACRPYLLREIALVQPRVIVALGATAAHVLLETDVAVGSLRGQVHRRTFAGQDTAIVVTFHPAYVLRKLSEKARVWDDLCLARQALLA